MAEFKDNSREVDCGFGTCSMCTGDCVHEARRRGEASSMDDDIKIYGVEKNNDDDWGVWACADNGVKYPVSNAEYARLYGELIAGSGVILDKTQIVPLLITEEDSVAYDFTEEFTDSPNDISVKVTADVDEAITGFKALQREIRETTKAIREYEEAVEGVPFHFDMDGNLTMIGAEITLDGKAVGKALESAISEEQARKDSIKRCF